MSENIDRYLSTLLSFTPSARRSKRVGADYISLIHIPAKGSEKVYSLTFGEDSHSLTVARYQDTIWEGMQPGKDLAFLEESPEVDVLRAAVDSDHPVFQFLSKSLLSQCENFSEGGPGLDYYLLMWQRSGCASVAECWEPYGRDDEAWTTLVSALEVLSSQYEYALANAEL